MSDTLGHWAVMGDDPKKESRKKRKKSAKYYDQQEDPAIADKPFGPSGTVGDNGCGGLALANALIAGGFGDHLDEICQYSCFSPSFTNVGGILGMSPLAMDYWLNVFFDPWNVDTVLDANYARNYDFIIVCYAYGKPELGAHCFFAENDGTGNYIVYNDSTFTHESSLNEIENVINTGGGILLWVWGIIN